MEEKVKHCLSISKKHAIQKQLFLLEWVENIAGEGEKCWLLSFSTFLQCFQRGFLPRLIISRAFFFCKGLTMYRTIPTFNDPEKEAA